jgi:hypothetical protein
MLALAQEAAASYRWRMSTLSSIPLAHGQAGDEAIISSLPLAREKSRPDGQGAFGHETSKLTAGGLEALKGFDQMPVVREPTGQGGRGAKKFEQVCNNVCNNVQVEARGPKGASRCKPFTTKAREPQAQRTVDKEERQVLCESAVQQGVEVVRDGREDERRRVRWGAEYGGKGRDSCDGRSREGEDGQGKRGPGRGGGEWGQRGAGEVPASCHEAVAGCDVDDVSLPMALFRALEEEARGAVQQALSKRDALGCRACISFWLLPCVTRSET